MEADKALDKARSYCSRAERCKADLKQKFYDWQVEQSIQEELLEKLTQENYINEERFALVFARDKYRFNGWGEYRIRQELRKRQISLEYIDRAWVQVEEEFNTQEQLQSLLEKKLRQTKSSQDKRKTIDQLIRFALYRGYDLEESKQIITRLLDLED